MLVDCLRQLHPEGQGAQRAYGAGALIRDGEDGTLLRLALGRELDELESARRYLDILIPPAVRGVEGEAASDFPGVGWLIHLPVEARADFLRGALDLLLQGVDGLGVLCARPLARRVA